MDAAAYSFDAFFRNATEKKAAAAAAGGGGWGWMRPLPGEVTPDAAADSLLATLFAGVSAVTRRTRSRDIVRAHAGPNGCGNFSARGIGESYGWGYALPAEDGGARPVAAAGAGRERAGPCLN
ncbi:hypothetical protein PAHAL_2G468500 [Panicum hallii]|jgi:hypothetical protein|uniref:Uncharacterized protein n=1 Tax=Panicum hallii TaxID=206008 RepID=A0A2T8KT49_9POAL|nr:hypothetical protein PAHAL_2G468500 [Panicum hallii]